MVAFGGMGQRDITNYILYYPQPTTGPPPPEELQYPKIQSTYLVISDSVSINKVSVKLRAHKSITYKSVMPLHAPITISTHKELAHTTSTHKENSKFIFYCKAGVGV